MADRERHVGSVGGEIGIGDGALYFFPAEEVGAVEDDDFNVGLRGDWDNGLNAEATYHYYGSVIYPPGASFSSLAQAGLITLPNPAVGSYNLLNLRGGYRFWQQMTEAGYMRDAEVAASVFNALNDGHNEYPIGETIGRRVMAWLTLRY